MLLLPSAAFLFQLWVRTEQGPACGLCKAVKCGSRLQGVFDGSHTYTSLERARA